MDLIVLIVGFFTSVDLIALLIYRYNKQIQDQRWQKYLDQRNDRSLRELMNGE